MQDDELIMRAKSLEVRVERDAGNPLCLPLQGADGCVHPDALYFPEGEQGYRYWLYYTPYPPQDRELPFLVRSNDGVRFTDRLVDNPLLQPSRWGWDSEYFADEDVIRVAPGRWIMYYAGNRKIQQIGVAMSSDGIRWKKSRKNPVISRRMWEKATGLKLEKNIRCPAALWDGPNKRVCLYFTARHDGIEEVFLATSSDGIEFRVHPKAVVKVGAAGSFDAGALHHIDVLSYRDMAVLVYVGSPKRDADGTVYSLGMAVSLDKVRWQKIGRNPFMEPLEAYEGRRLYRPTLCEDDSGIRLYYSVNDNAQNIRNISMARVSFSATGAA